MLATCCQYVLLVCAMSLFCRLTETDDIGKPFQRCDYSRMAYLSVLYLVCYTRYAVILPACEVVQTAFSVSVFLLIIIICLLIYVEYAGSNVRTPADVNSSVVSMHYSLVKLLFVAQPPGHVRCMLRPTMIWWTTSCTEESRINPWEVT